MSTEPPVLHTQKKKDCKNTPTFPFYAKIKEKEVKNTLLVRKCLSTGT